MREGLDRPFPGRRVRIHRDLDKRCNRGFRHLSVHILEPSVGGFHRTIAIASCEIVSKVVIVFEFASNALCAMIRLENSVAMLTLDCSSVLSSTTPRPPVPATPATAC